MTNQMTNDFNTDLNRVVGRPVITNVRALVIGGVDFATKQNCRWLPLNYQSDTGITITIKGYNLYDITEKRQSFGLDTKHAVAPRDLSWDNPIHKQDVPVYESDPDPVNGNDQFDTLTLYVSSNCPNMWDDDVVIQEYDLYSKYVQERDQSPTLAERYPAFHAYKIPREDITISNQNHLEFILPPPRVSGLIDVIIANRAGYTTCKTDPFHGLDQQNSDQTARFSTGVRSDGMIVVGTGEGCEPPPQYDPYTPALVPCNHEEWF